MLGSGRLLVLFFVAAILILIAGSRNASAAEYTCNSGSDCSSKIQAATSGDTVRLNASLTFATIDFNGADGITFDCDGFSVAGVDVGESINGIGIYLHDGSNNNTIRDCFFNTLQYGLFISGENNTITNATINYTMSGVFLAGDSNYNRLVNVTLVDEDVIIDYGSSYACTDSLVNVTGSGNRPIRYYNASVNLTGEVLSKLILCNASYSNITNITVTGAVTGGIVAYQTKYSNFSAINISASYGYNGNVWVYYSHNNSFTNLALDNNFIGGGGSLHVEYSDDNTFVNVTANYEQGTGVSVSSSQKNTFTGITANYNTYGISLDSSDNNAFVNITANYNDGDGFSVSSSLNNTFDRIIASNNYDGFEISGLSSFNVLNNSRIENSTEYGIILYSYDPDYALYNTFRNNLFNNSANLYSDNDQNQNYWNTTLRAGQRIYAGGNYIGGNYWASLDGTGYSQLCKDADGDGICDSAYAPATNNTDYLPLSDQYMIREITACRLLNETGWTYNLTQDITDSASTACMNVTADNVTLDCGGRRIDGTYTLNTYGVYMKDRKNVTVRNCTITDWWFGVFMNTSLRSNISASNLTGDNTGLRILNSWNNTLNDNFVNSIGTGVYLSNSSFNSISRNTIKNSDAGISFYLSSMNNTLSGNNLESFANYALYIYQSPDNFFRDSNITSTSTNIYHFASGNTVFLNVSLDRTKITVDAGAVYINWYLDVRVVGESGPALDQANVTVKNSGNTTLFSGTTNASGYIIRQNVTEFHQNFTGQFYYNNHTINASKFAYVSGQASVNVTSNRLVTITLIESVPYVQVKTYTLGLTETDTIKPGRIVRIRAIVNYIMGRDYLANATILIRDNQGSTVVDGALMPNVSVITNGYTYEYNYTIANGSAGVWSINVTAADTLGKKGYGSKKIAILPITLRIRLVLNSTSDSIYVPGEVETPFSGLTTSDYASPDHQYIASYSGGPSGSLEALVFSQLNPISVFTEKNADTYAIGTRQRFSGSMVLLVFSKGDWKAVNNRIGSVESGEFFASSEPSFGFGLGKAYPLKVVLSYSNLNITRDLALWKGYNRLAVENEGAQGGKVSISVTRG